MGRLAGTVLCSCFSVLVPVINHRLLRTQAKAGVFHHKNYAQMILTYLHLSRHAECNSLALAVAQGIIKCNELWNVRESKCLVKDTMHRREELTV